MLSTRNSARPQPSPFFDLLMAEAHKQGLIASVGVAANGGACDSGVVSADSHAVVTTSVPPNSFNEKARSRCTTGRAV